jgi:hypothetical protein
MKKILLALAGALVATTALAQSPSPQDRPDRDSSDRRDMYERRDGGEREGSRGSSWRDDMHRFHMMQGGRMGMEQGGGEARGARFRFQRGDARIDIRCGDNEPMSQCVDGASRLIDKVMSLRPASGGDASLPAPARPGAGAPDSLPRPQ